MTAWDITLKTIINLRENTYFSNDNTRNETKYMSCSLPKEDFITLVNLKNFRFLSLKSCKKHKQLDLVIFVSSSPENIERRHAIRATWGRITKGIKLFFMLGVVKNASIQYSIDTEFLVYLDIVQGNFIDSYKNLTYKFIMGFKFVIYYCSNTKFVMKTDDDTFVNMPIVRKYLKTIPLDQGHLISCNKLDGYTTARSESKWQVSFEEFPPKVYPIYCSGFAVIFSYETVFDIYKEAQRGDFFWIDDVFVTGT